VPFLHAGLECGAGRPACTAPGIATHMP
jgi:hypothetical protein